MFDRTDKLVNEWIQQNLVILYPTAEGDALFFPKFLQNQQGLKWSREKPSRYPLPDGFQHVFGDKPDNVQIVSDDSPELIRNESGVNPELIRNESGSGTAQEQVQVQVQVKDQVQDQVEVQVEVEVQEQEQEAAPPSSSSTIRQQVFDRLAGEWGTVNSTQLDKHLELVERYCLSDWRRGFDATKRGARANPTYVEKVIISEQEKANERGPPHQPKSKVEKSMDAVDAVMDAVKQEGIQGWE